MVEERSLQLTNVSCGRICSPKQGDIVLFRLWGNIPHGPSCSSERFGFLLCPVSYPPARRSSLGLLKWYLFIYIYIYLLLIESHSLCHSEELWNLRASSECCYYAGLISVVNFTGKISQNNQAEGVESPTHVACW